jgi:hypothetical protein
MINEWWQSDDRERYWMEITGREDLGVDLKAPQFNESGREYWSYDLIQHVRPGDRVLHYHTPAKAIVASSLASGVVQERDIVWGARGSSARTSAVEAHLRPGRLLPLSSYERLTTPLTLEALTEHIGEVQDIKDWLSSLYPGKLYYPFVTYRGTTLRAYQGYLTKFPRHLLSLSPSLSQYFGEDLTSLRAERQSTRFTTGAKSPRPWVTDIVEALRILGGVASYEQLYTELQQQREGPLTPSWEATVRNVIESHSSDSQNWSSGRPDLFYSVDGLGGGKWGLRELAPDTPRAVDVAEPTTDQAPPRVEMTTYRILRDTKLARGIKALHNHSCQICGTAIVLPDGSRYSEAHHVQPLGGSHNGPDIRANVMVLCPNHHAMCDLGAIELDVKMLRLHPSHAIGESYIAYHNEKVLRSH